jgi:CarboxypepD_reg-like domain
MKIPLLFFLCCVISQSWAQNLTQVIKGRVIDTESRQAIVGATVVLLKTQPLQGTTTDANGYFKLTGVAVGRHSVQVSLIGYESNTMPEIVVGTGKEIELNIRLSENLQQLQEVTVKAQKEQGAALNDMATVSARSFSVEQVKRYAAALNDPARMASTYAGVASGDDQGNALVIRGNSPKGVLWRMEGVEIPNPNHFAEEGATGGGISALSVNVLGNSDFFMGAFPAEYGNATSGVFDLKLRKGNQDKREYALQVGVLGADIAAEGPFKTGKKSSYLANYRYSTLEMLKKIGLSIAGDATPDFQDAAFKLYFQPNKKSTLSLWGMGGLSRQIRDLTTRNDAFHSDRGVVGLNHTYFISDKSFIENILSWSVNRQSYESSQKARVYVRYENYENDALRFSSQFNHKINAQHSLRIGGIVSSLSYNLTNRTLDGTKTYTYIDQKGSTYLLQGYGQWKYRLNPSLTLNTGIHGTVLWLNNQAALEPRTGLRWNITPRHSLSAGAGLHSRIESLSTYFAQVRVGSDKTDLVNKNLKLMKSAQGVLGYEFRPRDDWRLQIETYYQHHYHVPIGPVNTRNRYLLSESFLNIIDGYTTDSLVSQGKGRNYGVDVTIEKFLTNGFYFVATASLYQSKYTPRDGIERNTRFNGNFVQNLLMGKEWKVGKQKTNIIAANVRSLWAGGNRYAPIDLAKSQKQNSAFRIYEQAYESQIPAYFRFDMRLSYTKNRKKSTSTLSLDAQNVFNRLNLYQPYYDAATKSIKFDTQLGLVPIINWRLEF